MIRICFFVCLSSVLVFAESCTNDISEVKRLTADEPMPVSTTKNVEMTYSDSARLRAKIDAPLRETYMGEKSEVVFSKGVKVQFFNSLGKLESKMRANYAVSYTKNERFEARNNVIVENTSGDKLETEHLIWLQNEDRIYSDVFTKITSPDRVIFGDGFESNQDFSKYRILKVRGIIDLKE
ncbi:MAG: LPS export ABC transporter periplasmic protein LptC [Bacteroidia bacterium]